MNTFQAITKRRSIRQYQQKAVSQDDLLMIAEMGLHGPTSGDLQEIRFVIIRDQATINKFPPICMDQYWMSSAPAVIAVCSQPKEQANWYGERGRHVFSAQNAAAATQNILLAATELGLSTCWVGGYDQEAVDGLVGVGDDARVEALITVGYADEKPEKKEINEIKASIFIESYGNDKGDVDALNKDYSKKLEKKIQEVDKKMDTVRDRAKKLFEETSNKAKEAHKKYIVKK